MKWFLLTLLAGLLAASPFLTNRALGTKEAYNYSLSVADAVTQFRAGEVPMLVGQTAYAFNGRIHPLRTAPALAYATSLLDLVTWRQLGFWTLQNLTLALALVAAAGTCYACLRAATPATPPAAALLAGLYVMSPPLLASAYGMDLYMTVLAAPFVPAAIAANLLCLQGRRRGALWLAVALAGCWLAHPPVAFWLTVASVPLQGAGVCLRRPRWPDLGIWSAAAGLFLLLCGFGLVSGLTVTSPGGTAGNAGATAYGPVLQQAFARSLLPVSRSADQLGDFQPGYPVWILLGASLLAAVRQRCGILAALLAATLLLLCFVLPVPGVTRWLWSRSPGMVISLTGQWPMQRLYLLVVALVVFSSAFIRWPAGRPWARSLLAATATLWVLWQAGHFVWRGFGTHRPAEETARSHLPGYIDLTPISYAFGRLPQDFIHGVRDPAQAFRLLAPYDLHELATNWNAPLPDSPERVQGRLAAPAGSDGYTFTTADLTLQPGRRYRLDLEFLTPPFAGILYIRGPQVYRGYILPSTGGPRGFGMMPGNVPRLTLWTDLPGPETVSVALYSETILTTPPGTNAVARFTFAPIVDREMPVELLGLVPLRVRVDSPAPAYLETPRMFLPGYVATVDGRPVRVQRSPEGLALLPVPAGKSFVELRHPGTPLLRTSFWAGCLGWAGVAVGGLGVLTRAAWLTTACAWLASGLSRTLRRWLWMITAALAPATVTAFAWNGLRDAPPTAGPVRIRFVLPRGETGRQQPLLVTGRAQAGMFVYVVYHDAEHVRIGVDVWNRFGFQSGPIRTDYFAEQEIVVQAGALYPPGQSRPQASSEEPADRRLRIEFNGRTLLEQDLDTYPSLPEEVTIGRNRIGGSSCEPLFAGEILTVERLPPPAL